MRLSQKKIRFWDNISVGVFGWLTGIRLFQSSINGDTSSKNNKREFKNTLSNISKCNSKDTFIHLNEKM